MVKSALLPLVMMTIGAAAPPRVITVSLADPQAYHSVQAAIDALPAAGGVVAIAPGTYREKLSVARNHVWLRGTGRAPEDVTLVYGDAAATAGGTFKSATLTATGDAFRLSNVTVANDYWRDPAHAPSQAVALALFGDRDVVDHVRLLGDQDTLLASKGPGGRMARQYFRDCYIEGHVDFIFGNAKAYFDRCEIHARAHFEVMYTAQSRNAADEDSGYVFDHCRLTADPGAKEIALGRAWRPYATVVFLDTTIDAPVIKAGWREWHPGETNTFPTAYYAEYRSTGPGASPATREPFSHQLTAAQAEKWRLPAFFAHDIAWITEK